MTTLITKSIVRSGTGIIKDSEGNEIIVKVYKPKGLLNFRVLVEGIDKGFNELTAQSAWSMVKQMYSVWEVREPTPKQKKVNKNKDPFATIKSL
tara:strand:+ start:192 stop:473 length:282 start_codon:yes stop_codon:yes gene_type:complete